MENSRLYYLFQLQLQGKATYAEQEELKELMSNPGNEQEVKKLINNAWAAFEPVQPVFSPTESAAMLQNILGRKIKHGSKNLLVRRLSAAAAVLLAVSCILAYLVLNKNKENRMALAETGSSVFDPIKPGDDKATLTLSDGSVIVLDNASAGQLAKQGNTNIEKSKDGRLVYIPGHTQGNDIVYNTMSTPRGGQYTLRLPDGTNVWLNAASSIRFPTVFAGKERKVEIKGEAYFEVAKNPKMPFRVLADDMEVEVLGTGFNINAYADETAKLTTLIEGSVKIIKGKSSALLRPGQQAKVNTNENIDLSNNVNVDEVIAWKKGLFLFNATNIESIMRQVSRWYDVDVDYKIPASSGLRFTGIVSRRDNVDQILKIMELTGLVHFKIDGKKITVIP